MTITGLWACGRAMGKYKGKYPLGFIRRLGEIPLKDVQVVHLFAGKSTKINPTDVTIDIKPDVDPTMVQDCTGPINIKDKFADVVLIDPPYDSAAMAYGPLLYDTPPVKPYSFIKEAFRITKPGGYMYTTSTRLHHPSRDGQIRGDRRHHWPEHENTGVKYIQTKERVKRLSMKFISETA